jgi:cysteine synthase B
MVCSINHELGKRLHESVVVAAIGGTPLFRLRAFARDAGLPETVELWLKAEWNNPGGSIKDRPALAIVRRAIEDESLGDGRVLLDATSGNTGIAYAMLGAAIGFEVELVVAGSVSDERKRILSAYGATVRFSDPYDGSNGAIRMARQLAAQSPNRYFYADQYSNEANPLAHECTTGPEIWSQTGGRITHFVAGLGTTGTLMGTGRYLKRRNASIRLVGVQPSEAFHGIEGLKHLPTAIVPAIYDPRVPDVEIGIETEEAFELARRLARREGFFAGTSTGAALAAALRIGNEAVEGGRPATIVVVAPDGGEKYLSTGLWAE